MGGQEAGQGGVAGALQGAEQVVTATRDGAVPGDRATYSSYSCQIDIELTSFANLDTASASQVPTSGHS